MIKEPIIALFDLDGTLADYDGQIRKDLTKIASPNEPPVGNMDIYHDDGIYSNQEWYTYHNQAIQYSGV